MPALWVGRRAQHGDRCHGSSDIGCVAVTLADATDRRAVRAEPAGAVHALEPLRARSARRVQLRVRRNALAAVVDVTTIALALVLSALLQGPAMEPLMGRPRAPLAVAYACSLPLWLLVFAWCGLYPPHAPIRRPDEARRVFRAVLLGALATASAAALLGDVVSRRWFGVFLVVGVVFMTAERELVRMVRIRRLLQGKGRRRIVLVGGNRETSELRRTIEQDPTLGYELVGFVALPVADRRDPARSAVAKVRQAATRGDADLVLLSSSAVDPDTANRMLRDLTEDGLDVELSSTLFDVSTERLFVRPLGRFPIVSIRRIERTGWRGLAKRTFDVLVASFTLVVTSPILAIAAIAVKLDSPGPVLFRQWRVGAGDRPFNILKLRTMVVDAEDRLAGLLAANEADGPLFKMRADPRVTRVGRFLRRSSIDELPQLWNVLRGEMSLVGPRPALPREAERWDEEVRARLRVRPGITGAWQVSGRSSTTFDEYARLDLYYVYNWSLANDVAILLRTVPAVLRHRGAL
jgi:exopolysaccharide biosynthesis polyprenyl glycosylphosphotransferase